MNNTLDFQTLRTEKRQRIEQEEICATFYHVTAQCIKQHLGQYAGKRLYATLEAALKNDPDWRCYAFKWHLSLFQHPPRSRYISLSANFRGETINATFTFPRGEDKRLTDEHVKRMEEHAGKAEEKAAKERTLLLTLNDAVTDFNHALAQLKDAKARMCHGYSIHESIRNAIRYI